MVEDSVGKSVLAKAKNLLGRLDAKRDAIDSEESSHVHVGLDEVADFTQRMCSLQRLLVNDSLAEGPDVLSFEPFAEVLRMSVIPLAAVKGVGSGQDCDGVAVLVDGKFVCGTDDLLDDGDLFCGARNDFENVQTNVWVCRDFGKIVHAATTVIELDCRELGLDESRSDNVVEKSVGQTKSSQSFEGCVFGNHDEKLVGKDLV